ncbi:hypothetical protein GMLC_35400 [Geomonas limicola]|uniref:Lipoprotein n=1 Tax=Geomonas limicola TaxID=2740186 RepID=A0A6V8NBR9_9BACT|nr:hypothetical protein [Geomonas limicola]GFO69961.1 hypothetical protein GMLC_35400 [Geomonas limicola]
MWKKLSAVFAVILALTLTGCGSSSGPTVYTTQITRNINVDGYILNGTSVNLGTANVFAGIDSLGGDFRSFLDFSLASNLPPNAVIDYAGLRLYINDILPGGASVPIRIELVEFIPPLSAADFNTPAVGSTVVLDTITPADLGNIVPIDGYIEIPVTPLVQTAWSHGNFFQVRIMYGPSLVPPGVISINETTSPPELRVDFF